MNISFNQNPVKSRFGLGNLITDKTKNLPFIL